MEWLAEILEGLPEEKAGEIAARVEKELVGAGLRAAEGEMKIKDPELVAMLLDKEGASFEGLRERLEAIKKEKPYLFGGDVLAGRAPLAAAADAPAVTKEQFNGMGYRERMRLFEEQPDLYRSMIGEGM